MYSYIELLGKERGTGEMIRKEVLVKSKEDYETQRIER